MKKALIILRITSPLVALISGISVVIGQSLDASGKITTYGYTALISSVMASIISVVITELERRNSALKDEDDLKQINNSIVAQNRILHDLSRTFYKIESVDFSIEYIVSSSHQRLTAYKHSLDRFIQNLKIDENHHGLIKINEETSVITSLKDGKRSIFCISMTIGSELLPPRGTSDWSESLLDIGSDILIGSSNNFSLLNRNDLNPPIAYFHLANLCDLKIFAHHSNKQRKQNSKKPSFMVLSYYPEEGEFRVLSRNSNAVITHNNGKILSFTDVIGRQLTVFINDGFTRVFGSISLGEVRVEFNRSKSVDYSSYVHIKGSDMTQINGLNWQAYSYVIKGGFSV